MEGIKNLLGICLEATPALHQVARHQNTDQSYRSPRLKWMAQQGTRPGCAPRHRHWPMILTCFEPDMAQYDRMKKKRESLRPKDIDHGFRIKTSMCNML